MKGREMSKWIFLEQGDSRPIRYLGFPWQMARWILSPRYTLIPPDPAIDGLSIVRGIFAVASLLALKYITDPPDRPVPEAAAVGPWAIEAVTLVVGVIAMAIIFPLLAEEKHRAEARKQMQIPIVSLLASAVLLVLAGAGGEALALLNHYFSSISYARTVGTRALVLTNLAAPVGAWACATLFCGVLIFLRTLLRAQDGHPFLGPALVILITWAAWIGGFFLPDVYPFSHGLDLLIGISSAVTTTAIAIIQIWRYRSHYGISLRTGPRPNRQFQAPTTPWFMDLDRWKEESWKRVREPVTLVSGRILFWTGILLAVALGLSGLETVAGVHMDFADSFRYYSAALSFVPMFVVSGWYILRYRQSYAPPPAAVPPRSRHLSRQPGPGWPERHTRGKVSGRAIAALAAVFIFPPAALVLAIAALTEIRRYGRGGVGLAMIALILSTVAIGMMLKAVMS
jgi:hypothetical protein